jgi:hypothetical protein
MKMDSLWNSLHVRSFRSLVDSVNHNCVVVAASIHVEYGLILAFEKISTRDRFNLDLDYIRDELWLSQGRGYDRYLIPAPAKVFKRLRPKQRQLIKDMLLFINNNVDLHPYFLEIELKKAFFPEQTEKTEKTETENLEELEIID